MQKGYAQENNNKKKNTRILQSFAKSNQDKRQNRSFGL
jgi:hypothetical protein